jgi:hypothetical protein
MPALVMSPRREPRTLADFSRSAAIAPTTLAVQDEPGIGKMTPWLMGIDQACVNGFRVGSTLPGAALTNVPVLPPMTMDDVVRTNPGGGATDPLVVDRGPR